MVVDGFAIEDVPGRAVQSGEGHVGGSAGTPECQVGLAGRTPIGVSLLSANENIVVAVPVQVTGSADRSAGRVEANTAAQKKAVRGTHGVRNREGGGEVRLTKDDVAFTQTGGPAKVGSNRSHDDIGQAVTIYVAGRAYAAAKIVTVGTSMDLEPGRAVEGGKLDGGSRPHGWPPEDDIGRAS